MSYAVEQRLRFIDCMLLYYGKCSRNEVTDYFGIGLAQATRDFGAYQDAAPDNIFYDVSAKAYARTKTFARLYK